MGAGINNSLLTKIRSCKICQESLPYKPKPILSFAANSLILIVGQAPGVRAHMSGIPWNDASGERLRDWLGVTKEQFYDPEIFAIAPMGFCYPGKGSSGDKPPRPECSEKWMKKIVSQLGEIRVTLLIGTYAQDFFLDEKTRLTETVKRWREFAPTYIPLPHPSPRNNIWLKKNSWFETDLLPYLRKTTSKVLKTRPLRG